MADFGIRKTLDLGFDEALARVPEALKAEGFGVLTEIDVKKTLHEKIGAELDPYIILGACNPKLAYRALQIEPEIGLLLPCNVTVRAEGDGCRVDIADPNAMMGIAGAGKLDDIAAEAREKLSSVVASLESQNTP